MQDEDQIQEFSIRIDALCQFCGNEVIHPKETMNSALWCNQCKRYGVNCSLCQQSLRESALFCIHCGHGGHINEISSWFLIHEECPSGCGCRCGEMINAQRDEELYYNELWKSRQIIQPKQSNDFFL